MRLTAEQQCLIRELRYGDGLTMAATAARVGCGRHDVQRVAPGRPGKVPNDKLREAFTDSGLSAAEVARRVGWLCSTGETKGQRTQADRSRVLRSPAYWPTPPAPGGGLHEHSLTLGPPPCSLRRSASWRGKSCPTRTWPRDLP